VKLQKLPHDIVRQWPEVLSDVNVKEIPLQYTSSVAILFKNGKTWNLPCKVSRVNKLEFFKNLQEMLSFYGDSILTVDFRLDINKIKLDSTRSIKKFFKDKVNDSSNLCSRRR
jgi:hypothetical protein